MQIDDSPVSEHPVDYIAIRMTCPPLCWISGPAFPDFESHPMCLPAQLGTGSYWRRLVEDRSLHAAYGCNETGSKVSDEGITLGIRKMVEIDGE